MNNRIGDVLFPHSSFCFCEYIRVLFLLYTPVHWLLPSTSGFVNSSVHFKPVFYLGPSIVNTWLSTIAVISGNMTFPHYRSDPSFPARRYRALPESAVPSFLPEGYFNDNEYASIINCEESVEIRDAHKKCRRYRLGWVPPGYRFQNWEHLEF